MEGSTTSYIIIGIVLLGLMFTTIPVFMSLFFTALVGFVFFTDYPVMMLAQALFRSMDKFALVVVLFFILCGNIMTSGSIVDKLIRVANALVGWLPGDWEWQVFLRADYLVQFQVLLLQPLLLSVDL